MDTEKRILFCGESLANNSGLSYISSSFLKMFKKNGFHNLGYCVISGEPTTETNIISQGQDFVDLFNNSLMVYNVQLVTDKAKNFDLVIENFKPDIVITFLDPWKLEQIVSSKYKHSYYTVSYLTAETDFYPEFCMFPNEYSSNLRKPVKSMLEKIDLIIPVTEQGRVVYSNMVLKNVSDENVYNAVDSFDFDYDENDFQEIRKRAFGGIVKEDDIVFMTVGANNERKKIDRTLTAFYEFLKQVKERDKNKFKLYIHTNVNEMRGGTDIFSLMELFKLNENVLFPKDLMHGKQVAKEKLYERYIASDIYISLPAGEGFGLPYCEALSFKKPVIFTDHGGHVEYCKNHGLPVKVSEKFFARNINMMWALADINDAVKQIRFLVENASKRKEFGRKGYEFVKKNCTWDIVFKKLVDIIDDNYKDKDIKSNKFLLKKII